MKQTQQNPHFLDMQIKNLLEFLKRIFSPSHNNRWTKFSRNNYLIFIYYFSYVIYLSIFIFTPCGVRLLSLNIVHQSLISFQNILQYLKESPQLYFGSLDYPIKLNCRFTYHIKHYSKLPTDSYFIHIFQKI